MHSQHDGKSHRVKHRVLERILWEEFFEKLATRAPVSAKARATDILPCCYCRGWWRCCSTPPARFLSKANVTFIAAARPVWCCYHLGRSRPTPHTEFCRLAGSSPDCRTWGRAAARGSDGLGSHGQVGLLYMSCSLNSLTEVI